jgi:hypothetical protein
LLGAGQASCQYTTLTGTLAGSNGAPAQNYIISFTISQMGYISSTGVVVNVPTYCATSTNGAVVGVPNPLAAPPVTTGFTGTLPAANYFVKVAFYDATGNVTLVSPERQIALGSTGRLIIAAPVGGMPAGAVGQRVYISTSTNAETLQGSSTGSASYIQSIPLVTGANPSATNTTICKQIANDAIWPSGTGYTVALTDPSGNTIPGYPMQWQLMGPNTTINLSNGLPYYHGVVYFPTPILASPLNNALQSIAGPLSLSGYNLIQVGAIGLCTSLPAWGVDDECEGDNAIINANGGYLYNGLAPLNHLLVGNGTAYIDSATVPASAITGLFYQTMQSNTTAQNQRTALNFSTDFALSDSASPSRTTANLAASGATAGTYTNPTVTVTAKGIVTSIANGSTVNPTVSVVTGSRAWATVYHNTNPYAIAVMGYGSSTGSATNNLACEIGASSSPSTIVWSSTNGATTSGGNSEFMCPWVPAGWYYEVLKTNDITASPTQWVEVALQ